ncbi:serine/arginine repetitive matrix protein 1-like isoform X3 [Physella acuta]|uniref:serine/arginine repetitive matrix protein 1-like isoform X3 n=1 Tax=Physella acuta TaxID=109671 RepID=UPI0027DCC621|nr:serine/arginine repetitive matrix protein 1-like isoform X3 [Physella acuta]
MDFGSFLKRKEKSNLETKMAAPNPSRMASNAGASRMNSGSNLEYDSSYGRNSYSDQNSIGSYQQPFSSFTDDGNFYDDQRYRSNEMLYQTNEHWYKQSAPYDESQYEYDYADGSYNKNWQAGYRFGRGRGFKQQPEYFDSRRGHGVASDQQLAESKQNHPTTYSRYEEHHSVNSQSYSDNLHNSSSSAQPRKSALKASSTQPLKSALKSTQSPKPLKSALKSSQKSYDQAQEVAKKLNPDKDNESVKTETKDKSVEETKDKSVEQTKDKSVEETKDKSVEETKDKSVEEEDNEEDESIQNLPSRHNRGLMSTLIALAGPSIQNRKPDPLPPPAPMKLVDDNEKYLQAPKQVSTCNPEYLEENGITQEMLEQANIDADSVNDRDILPHEIGRCTDRVEFFCKLCQVQTTSSGNFRDHLNGKSHKSKYEAFKKGIRPSSNKKKKTVQLPVKPGEKSVTLELLKTFQEPILGLAYITEYHSGTGIICVCNLCVVKFDFNIVASHVTGTKHRLHYLKEKQPSVYVHLKKFGGKKSQLTAFLDELSFDAEKKDGRGEPVIKIFEHPPKKETEEAGDIDDLIANEEKLNEGQSSEEKNQATSFQDWVNKEINIAQKKKEEKKSLSPAPGFPADSKNVGHPKPSSESRAHLNSSSHPEPRPPPKERLYLEARPLEDPFHSRFPPPDPFFSFERIHRFPPKDPYLDRDPLDRVLNDSAHTRRIKNPDPYLDPDPLKRVPVKKSVAPVVIDYGHKVKESSSTQKADKWEDDIRNILGPHSKNMAPDSLALLSSSYSSPKHSPSPSKEVDKRPKRPLPFSKTYLEIAQEKLKNKEADKLSKHSSNKRNRSPTPEGYVQKDKERNSSKHPRSNSPSRSVIPQNERIIRTAPKQNPSLSRNSSETPHYGHQNNRKSKSPPRHHSSSKSCFRPRSKTPPEQSTPAQRSRSPPRQIAPARSRSPPRQVAPERSRSPPRQVAPERSRSPLRQMAPPRSRSPPRQIAPARSRSPPRQVAPERSRSPLRQMAPPRSRSPPRQIASARSRSPPRQVAPERSRSPLRQMAPERSRSPLRQMAPPRSRSPPTQIAPARRSRTPPKERSPPRAQGVQRMKNILTEQDEDEQAERIANLLLSMSSSLAASGDFKGALQKLLLDSDLAKTLLSSRIKQEPDTSPPGGSRESFERDRQPSTSHSHRSERDDGRSQSTSHRSERNDGRSSMPVQQSKASSREKVVFSMAGSRGQVFKSTLPSDFGQDDDSD